MFSPAVRSAVAAVKRYWVVALVATIAGAGVALASTPGAEIKQVGTAVIVVDELSQVRYAPIVDPERVLRALRRDEFALTVADLTGEPADTVKAALGAYVSGLPTEEIRVTYAAGDAETAERLASAAGEAAMAEIDRLNGAERSRQDTMIEAFDAALAAAEQLPTSTSKERYDQAAAVAGIIAGREGVIYNRTLLDAAYNLEPGATVAVTTSERRTVENTVGGAIVGLVFGILFAVIRGAMVGKPDSVS